jgi:hypothetical protein
MSLQASKLTKAAPIAVLLITWWLFYFDGPLKNKLPSIAISCPTPETIKPPTPEETNITGNGNLPPDFFWPNLTSPHQPLSVGDDHTPSTASSYASAAHPKPTPIILYAYAPSGWALPNLQFFLIHGLHASATFIFIFNGALNSDLSPVESLDGSIAAALTLLEPFTEEYSNIQIIKRPNTCYDLGAYGEVLLANDSALYRSHQRFILINASLRGPFIPFWSRECWSDAYLRQLDELDHMGRQVKLVGMTFNCWSMSEPGHRHVQSMLLATDQVGMGIWLGKRKGLQ